MIGKFRSLQILSVLILVLVTGAGLGQFRAGIQGVVTDATGAVLPGATITVVNKETGVTREVVSGETGFYRVSALPPGRYRVTAGLPGFKMSAVDDVIVRAEEIQGLNFRLDPGEISEVVEVSGEAIPPLQTESANIDRVLGRQEILRLPQVGRDPYELIRLTPGIFGNGARDGSGNSVALPNTTGPGGSNLSIFQVENQVPISANGQRISTNAFQIDGVSVNSLGWGGAAVVTPNQESVKELRVLANSYSAEDGRNSGAQIKVISQNGTNEFHGSILFKLNDPTLNAFNKWGGPTASPALDAPPVRVERRFRQLGGSLGGPILKDKLFFFFSHEGLRESTNNPVSVWLETPEWRNLVRNTRSGGVTARILSIPGIEPRVIQSLASDCSIFGGQAATRCRVVPGGLDIGSPALSLGQYVDAPTGAGFDGIPDIFFAQIENPRRTSGNQFNFRTDFTQGHNSFAVSTYITTSSDTASGARPSSDTRNDPLNTSGTFTFIRTLSPRLLNEFRINGTRFAFNQLKASKDTNYGIPRVEIEGIPNIGRIRFGAPRGETSPGIFAQNTYELRDTLSWVRGNQVLKFGLEFRREQDNNNLLGGARPVYSFVGPWNIANDTPIFEAINTEPSTGAPTDAQRYFRTDLFGLFMQDDWKLSPNLTLNLGLRYEYFSPTREKRGRLTNLVLGSNGFQNARVEIVDRLFEADRNNFAHSPTTREPSAAPPTTTSAITSRSPVSGTSPCSATGRISSGRCWEDGS